MPFKSNWTFGLDNEITDFDLTNRCNLISNNNNNLFYRKTSLSDTKTRLFQCEQPTSPTDRVNKLADWFQSCTLDEDKPNDNRSINSLTSPTNPFLLSSSSSLLATTNHLSTNESSPQKIQSKSNEQSSSSSSKILSSIFIFFLGLVLGYILTHTFPPHVLYQWILIVQQISIQISEKSFRFLIEYLQVFLKHFSSYNPVI